jgi:acylphosphatase
MNRVHIVVTGRVQGVYFRQSTQEQALALGVSGWVRNRSDGSVEMVAEGHGSAIEQLVKWCEKGPEMARVDSVERMDEEPVGLPEGFDVRPTM